MTELKLGTPFTDHLVLQRGRANPVWGHDRPGQGIVLRVEGPKAITVETQADEQGAFSLSCPPLPSGGPYRVRILGSSEVVLDDVLSGEVWLASGQSNMEWSVASSANAGAEIEAATDSAIRTLKVERQASWERCEVAQGSWVPASPRSAGDFTAVGFYFARELRRVLDCPVGVLDCTWGGTPIAAWMSLPALRAALPEVDAELAQLRADMPRLPELTVAHQRELSAWEDASLPADPPLADADLAFARLDFDDSAWEHLELPAFWQHHGHAFNGVVWFRRTLELPGDWVGRDLALSLGAIDDFDHTYFNGELVGSIPARTPDAFQTKRHYVVPGRLVRLGRNVVTVRVFDHFGEGGFAGPARLMSIAPVDEPDAAMPLAGTWRLHPQHRISLVPGSIFATHPTPPLLLTPQYIPGQLHHGMVAPVAPYGVRGFLWYQGESDVEHHADYARRQIALVRDLRASFGGGTLPFLYVELAGYRGGPTWPYLREAQQQAEVEPGTTLVTARDIGDPDDIHPRNKQEVGRRLALAARANVYGEAVRASGPRMVRVTLEQGAAVVEYAAARGLRARTENGPVGFELAGRDGQFYPAQAAIEGESVRVCAAEVPEPAFVRYAFTDTGEGDLENDAGLPALSFRTDGQVPTSS